METPSGLEPGTDKSIEKLAEALAKAQGDFPVIPKNSEVIVKSKEGKELYRYKYADLTTIISHTRPAFAKNGLSFTQGFVNGGFVTRLLHSSGQALRTGFIPCEVNKGMDMKSVAGLVTYVKRISLSAALGVSADEDVDAAANEVMKNNSTSRPTQGPQPKPAAKPNQHAPATKQMIEEINMLCMDRGVSESELHQLIIKGYGCKINSVPTWVANEIAKLLYNEDTDSAKISAETQRVASRRAAAELKKGGG